MVSRPRWYSSTMSPAILRTNGSGRFASATVKYVTVARGVLVAELIGEKGASETRQRQGRERSPAHRLSPTFLPFLQRLHRGPVPFLHVAHRILHREGRPGIQQRPYAHERNERVPRGA